MLAKGDVMTNDGPCMKIDKMCTCNRPIDHLGKHSCEECSYTWADEDTVPYPENGHTLPDIRMNR